jgi:hypothetical protein
MQLCISQRQDFRTCAGKPTLTLTLVRSSNSGDASERRKSQNLSIRCTATPATVNRTNRGLALVGTSGSILPA